LLIICVFLSGHLSLDMNGLLKVRNSWTKSWSWKIC